MGKTENSGLGWHYSCCNSPKTACLIIAMVQMVISFLLLVGGSVTIGWFSDEMGPSPEVDPMLIGGLLLAEGAVLLVTSTILIQGTKKGRPNYLLCWMIIFGLGMVLNAIVGVTIFVHVMFRFHLYMLVLAFVLGAIVLGISTYLVAIVNSHRDQLLNSSETEKEEDWNQLTPSSTSKTASLIIGVAHLVISILALVVLGSLDLLGMFYWLIPPYSYYYNLIRGLTIAGLAVQIATSAILIHGTRKGRPGYLLFWMIIFGLSIVLTAIGVLIMADYYFEFMFVSTFISVSIALISSAYLVAIVNSHMRQLLNVYEIEKEEDLSRLTPNSTSKTASLIIGVVHMVISIVTLAVLGCIDFSWSYSAITRYNLIREWLFPPNSYYYNLIRGLTIAGLAVQIAISAILIQGTRKGNSGYLLCWIVMFGICTGTAAIGALTHQSIQVAIAVQHAYIPQWVITEMIMTCVIVAIVVGFFSYLMVMVNSHRKELLPPSQDMDTEGNTKPQQELENKTYNKMYLEKIQLVIEKIMEKLVMII